MTQANPYRGLVSSFSPDDFDPLNVFGWDRKSTMQNEEHMLISIFLKSQSQRENFPVRINPDNQHSNFKWLSTIENQR